MDEAWRRKPSAINHMDHYWIVYRLSVNVVQCVHYPGENSVHHVVASN